MAAKKTSVDEEEDPYDDVFLEELPEYLRCPICLSCLSNPYQTPCGHRFCKHCILPILQSRNNLCPNDRTSIDVGNTFPDNAVKLQINGLKIRCPMEGCEWVGEKSDKLDHLAKCKFMAVKCPLCGQSMLKTKLEDHLKTCPQRKVTCKYCQSQVAFSGLDGHHATCPDYPVPCSYECGTSLSFTRKDITSHLAVCPRAPVACTMECYGCVERVERCCMEQHLKTCVPRHMGKVCEVMEALREEVKELKSVVAIQNERIVKMESYVYPCSGQFSWRIDNIREKIKLAQGGGDESASVMYSPSFHSLEGGYKLSLCIYPAGDNNQGYMSLYFVVMKGQFDEILQWPFQKRVYLSLLNTRGGQSVTKDIHPDPRLHYFHRPENPRNVGYGYPKFIPLSVLQAPQSDFVENEAIFLRCRIFD